MSDRAKNIEFEIFRFLATVEDVEKQQMSIHRVFNSLYKSNGLLTAAAFPNGRMVTTDEVRGVVREMAREGWVAIWDTLSDVYFKLTDHGLVEMKKWQIEAGDFESALDDISKQRWSRLRSVLITEKNAAQVSALIDKSLNELGKHELSNEQHRQAASYMLAAKELVNAPVPPSEIIWDLIQKAAAIAALVQFILPIFSALI